MSHDKGGEKDKELVLLSVSVDRSCYINEVKQKGKKTALLSYNPPI